jgi:leucyl-tRNA synthetase
VWRVAVDIEEAGLGSDPATGEVGLRTSVHRWIDECTTLMQQRRLYVVVARLMELTSALRKADDGGALSTPAGAAACREGAEVLARMLTPFAPFTAEEIWSRLGNEPSVVRAGWPVADPALVREESVVCVVQVAGKVRDRLDVPVDIDEASLRELALASDGVRRALGARAVRTVIVRPPKLVNVVPDN